MKKMKHMTSLMLIALSFLLLLAACSGQSAQNNNQSTASPGSTAGNAGGGSKAPQGVTDAEVLIGYTGPQSGPGAIFDTVRKGADSLLKYVNENGGVNGRKIKLISYDDEGQPSKTVQLAKRLVEEDKVYAIVASVGTVSNLAALDYYKQKGVPVIMLGAGVSKFVNPTIDNIVGLGIVNYSVEASLMLDYAAKQLKVQKIGIAYTNDDVGKENLEAVKKSLSKYPGVSIVAEVNFANTNVDFSSQAQKLQEAGPDVILGFTSSNPAANLKKALYKIGVKVPYFVTGPAGNDTKLFDLAGKDVWEGSYSTTALQMPGYSEHPSVKLYTERFSKDYPKEPILGNGQQGWAQTEVFVEGLKRAGNNLAWNDFINTFHSFNNWQGSMYAGITFSKNNHYGATSLMITQAKDGKIQPVTNTITYNPETGDVVYK